MPRGEGHPRHDAAGGHTPPAAEAAEAQHTERLMRLFLGLGEPLRSVRAQCTPMAGAAGAAPPRALMVIHFTRFSDAQARQQGGVLALSRPSYLVGGADGTQMPHGMMPQ